jgi:hypothetical protein
MHTVFFLLLFFLAFHIIRTFDVYGMLKLIFESILFSFSISVFRRFLFLAFGGLVEVSVLLPFL